MGARNRRSSARDKDFGGERRSPVLNYGSSATGKFDKDTLYEVPFEDRALAKQLIDTIFEKQNKLVIKEREVRETLIEIQNLFDDLFSLCGQNGRLQLGNLKCRITCNSKSGIYVKDTNALGVVYGAE